MQKKTLSLVECEIKMQGDAGTFAGYASVFNKVDSYGDTILPGAYTKTLSANGLPKMFLQHESWELPIGKWTEAKEDDHGLFVKGELTLGMARADDTHAALKHGTLDGLSIGYRLAREDYDFVDGSDMAHRIIKNVSLLAEVSPVVFPADQGARIDLASVKSDIEEIKTIRDFENFLRDAGGFSKGLSQKLIAQARSIFSHRDDEEKNAEILAMIAKIDQKMTIPLVRK